MYERFQIAAPRGVLFHGPPGCGKTLLARALVSECSTETRKVSFFMRKGADCLSKWVGEAEKQLKLLFEEARKMQPSIIFFDEIDGLAPVRSAKQEQIYSSIVSTLLALMDGLDSRGQVVIIGATNRVDAVDPALRRPGRFDREFFFPLPNEVARRKVIDIHTKGWEPRLSTQFKNNLAVATKGYCGADIKGLCTEAALKAIQRMYPQVYESAQKLVVDPSKIVVTLGDFQSALQAVTPASHRSTTIASSPLPQVLQAPLQSHLEILVSRVSEMLFLKTEDLQDPASLGSLFSASPSSALANYDFLYNESHFTDSTTSIPFPPSKSFASHSPRLLICGEKENSGKGPSYLGAALLHEYDGIYIQSFELATLMADSGRTPEANCISFFAELKSRTPSIAFVPEIDTWWASVSKSLRTTFISLLLALPPTIPVLLLATTPRPFSELRSKIQKLFTVHVPFSEDVYMLPLPSREERALFFESVVRSMKTIPPDTELRGGLLYSIKRLPPPTLPLAPPPPPRRLTLEEEEGLRREEEVYLRKLRVDLRLIVEELLKVRKYSVFHKPPDFDLASTALRHKAPMFLSKIMEKIDSGLYLCPRFVCLCVCLFCSLHQTQLC
jgi:SpoVK/Ycf46/Vps4 family AAA+-type ATPase